MASTLSTPARAANGPAPSAVPMPRGQRRRAARALAPLATAALLALGPGHALALDLAWGPLKLTGFAKAEVQHGSNVCEDCQFYPSEEKQRVWADRLRYGARYDAETSHVTLFQPFLVADIDIGRGMRLQGLLSQRWRDGSPDIRGFVFERNAGISHEDWGSIRLGAMTSRAWSVADYPYGTNIGVANAWASSGAGYGLLTRAARVQSRKFDVLEGDLVVEATYDAGKRGWNKNEPRFLEVFAQYVRGDLVVDAIYQDARNGTPSAWGQSPFTGLTPFPQDDLKLGNSGQSILLVMARYQIDARWEVSGGVRANRWSGAYARVTGRTPDGTADLWNNMFNVDWNCKDAMPSRCAIDNPGYPARSIDAMAGLRARMGQWTASTGHVFLGEADTRNPSERGQGNAALISTAGLSYDLRNGLQLYGFAGMVHFKRKGLSPMSMPTNNAFTGVDSRVATNGRWLGFGATYTF